MPDSSPARKSPEHRGLLGAGSRLRHPFRRRGHQPDSNPDHAVVRLSGEITSANAERLGKNLEEILRSQPGVLEIDLGGVTYLHGDGGTVFFMALRAARAPGTWVMATHVGRQPLGALNQLGLGRALDLYEGDGPIDSPGEGE